MPSSFIHSSKYKYKNLEGGEQSSYYLIISGKGKFNCYLFLLILGFSEVQAESLTASLVDIITSSVHSVANSTVSKIDQVKKIQFMS